MESVRRPRALISASSDGSVAGKECEFRQCIKRALWGAIAMGKEGETPKDPLLIDLRYDIKSMELFIMPAKGDAGIPLQEIEDSAKAERKEGDPAPRSITISYHQPVRVAVCMVAQNEFGCALLTKRGPTMRAFPGAWVVPGGHVDPNESLEVAAIRELREETGLVLVAGTVPRRLCVWESTYPHQLSLGEPKVQHVVVFYVCQVHNSAVTFMAKLNIGDPDSPRSPSEISKSTTMRLDKKLFATTLDKKLQAEAAEKVSTAHDSPRLTKDPDSPNLTNDPDSPKTPNSPKLRKDGLGGNLSRRDSMGDVRMQAIEVCECCWLDVEDVQVLCDREGDTDERFASWVRGEEGHNIESEVAVGEIRKNLAEGTRFALLEWAKMFSSGTWHM